MAHLEIPQSSQQLFREEFPEQNDNSHKEITAFEIHEVVAQRLGRDGLGNGKLSNLRTSSKKRAESQPFDAYHPGARAGRCVSLPRNMGIQPKGLMPQ